MTTCATPPVQAQSHPPLQDQLQAQPEAPSNAQSHPQAEAASRRAAAPRIAGQGATDVVVAAFMREPLDGTMRFLNWYKAQGASRILLYFDNPQDTAIYLLQGIPGVECVRCTAPFWESLVSGARPSLVQRQELAMAHAYSRVGHGWFMKVDGDELVYLDGVELNDLSAAQSAEQPAFQIAMAEQIHARDPIPGIHFRLPVALPPDLVSEVYGDLAHIMEGQARLMSAHRTCPVIRADLNAHQVRLLWSGSFDSPRLIGQVAAPTDRAVMLTYSDDPYRNWMRKIPRWMGDAGYREVMSPVLAPIFNSINPEAGMRALYRDLHVFDLAKFDALARAGAWFQLDALSAMLLKQDDIDHPDLAA